MIFGKKVLPHENHLLKFEKVSCEDCRFIQEENIDGEKCHICLALARRRINPREKKECQRFLKKVVERKIDVEIEKTISDTNDFFDIKDLYKLMSGKGN